jgi:hypothetical protein
MTKVTYNAPKGDERVVEMRGHTFFDGQPVEIDDEVFLEKLSTNQLFEVAERKAKAPAKAKAPVEGLKAVHIAGGRFKIVDGDVTVKEGLNKSDADAFNALSPEDKAEYVA